MAHAGLGGAVVDPEYPKWYYNSMKYNTKSSITLPPSELALVEELRGRLGAKSKVDVIRRGLMKLKESTDRDLLRTAYASAAGAVRESTLKELAELDPLTPEGLDP